MEAGPAATLRTETARLSKEDSMKVTFGVNTQVWFGGFSTKNFDVVEKAARLGFQFLEISYGEMVPPFDPRELKKRIDDAGLGIGLCGYLMPDRDITSTEGKVVENGLAYFTGAAKTAETLGARIFCGPLYAELFRGRWLSAADRAAEWERGVAGLKKAGAICADRGLTLALEPINRFETDFLNTAHNAVRLVQEVGSRNVKIHLDTFHMNIEEKNIGKAITEAGSHLAHFHCCGNDRGAPGSEHVPWREVAEALKTIDYRGVVSIEGFNPADSGLANGGKIWRPVAPNQDSVASEGLAFLRSVFV
jgi:D-psicose/D-tagatose/L-ribulose 3-epimerase